jgi:hypothetical protein
MRVSAAARRPRGQVRARPNMRVLQFFKRSRAVGYGIEAAESIPADLQESQ